MGSAVARGEAVGVETKTDVLLIGLVVSALKHQRKARPIGLFSEARLDHLIRVVDLEPRSPSNHYPATLHPGLPLNSHAASRPVPSEPEHHGAADLVPRSPRRGLQNAPSGRRQCAADHRDPSRGASVSLARRLRARADDSAWRQGIIFDSADLDPGRHNLSPAMSIEPFMTIPARVLGAERWQFKIGIVVLDQADELTAEQQMPSAGAGEVVEKRPRFSPARTVRLAPAGKGQDNLVSVRVEQMVGEAIDEAGPTSPAVTFGPARSG
ncbi:hypothetical protein BXY51_008097 [Actinoplanes cyaneus]|nr:hypothetical protein [Actinoplanes cyaneus]